MADIPHSSVKLRLPPARSLRYPLGRALVGCAWHPLIGLVNRSR